MSDDAALIYPGGTWASVLSATGADNSGDAAITAPSGWSTALSSTGTGLDAADNQYPTSGWNTALAAADFKDAIVATWPAAGWGTVLTAAGRGLDGAEALTVPSSWSMASTGYWTYDAALVEMPGWVVAGSGYSFSGNASLTLPSWSIYAEGPNTAGLSTPSWVMDATGLTGPYGFASPDLPRWVVSATGSLNQVGNAANSFSMLTVRATGFNSPVGSAYLTTPSWNVLAKGITGKVWNGAMTLPSWNVSGVGRTIGTWVAVNTLPSWSVTSSGFTAVAENYRLWALNLHKLALTEYTNLPVNSFATLNGELFAATSTGLIKLNSSDLDDTAAISATMITGKPDFDSSLFKRIPRAYLTVETDGDLEFHTYTTEDGRRRYLVPYSEKAGLNQQRVPIGKGPKSRYWQFGFANRQGSDFILSAIVVYPKADPRRNY